MPEVDVLEEEEPVAEDEDRTMEEYVEEALSMEPGIFAMVEAAAAFEAEHTAILNSIQSEWEVAANR